MLEVIGYKGITRVFALTDHIQTQPFGKGHGHILHGMHRQVRLIVEDCGLKLFDEQPLAADFCQRRVKQLIAAADHGHQADGQLGVQLFKARFDKLGLPQGQGALAGGNSQMSTHGILVQNQPA